MNRTEEQQTRAWIATWRESAVALDEIRAGELRLLTEDESARWFAEMVVDTEMVWISPERADATGMVEQQRLFMRSHEHPARHQRRP